MAFYFFGKLTICLRPAFSPKLASARARRAPNDQAKLSQKDGFFMARTQSCTRPLAAGFCKARVAPANLAVALPDTVDSMHGMRHFFPANKKWFGELSAGHPLLILQHVSGRKNGRIYDTEAPCVLHSFRQGRRLAS